MKNIKTTVRIPLMTKVITLTEFYFLTFENIGIFKRMYPDIIDKVLGNFKPEMWVGVGKKEKIMPFLEQSKNNSEPVIVSLDLVLEYFMDLMVALGEVERLSASNQEAHKLVRTSGWANQNGVFDKNWRNILDDRGTILLLFLTDKQLFKDISEIVNKFGISNDLWLDKVIQYAKGRKIQNVGNFCITTDGNKYYRSVKRYYSEAVEHQEMLNERCVNFMRYSNSAPS